MTRTFELIATSGDCSARRGRLHTPHGAVETPVFMPVGTQGSVKAMSQAELRALGFSVILGNTYHLHLRPGEASVQRLGGLHRFIGWDRSILTDSGGFQVFSLREMRTVTEDGVRFRSHIDGSEHFFSPESSLDVQLALGSDVAMAFDECAPHPADRGYVRQAMDRTHRWAKRCRDHWSTADRGGRLLFGIVQGGAHLDLRSESVAAIRDLDFPGVAIGGVSVGEPKQEMEAVVRHTAPLLPDDRPRYLMGVGTPEDILNAVTEGVDMFDCVLPTRLGRNGTAYTSRGRIQVKGLRYAEETGPLDPTCDGWCCREHSAAYVRHLYRANEILASRVITYHNLWFYARLMRDIRSAIEADRMLEFRADALARLRGDAEGVAP